MINGLWLTKQGEEPILISQGTYSSPVVIPDANWVFCSKADRGWAHPSKVVKIDLNTFEETVIDLPPADMMCPVVFINDRLLIIREGIGYLYDVSADTLEEVHGDFECFTHPARRSYGFTGRFLQKASTPDTYYALRNQYTVGVLNTKTFKFNELARYSVSIYNTNHIWSDEENDVIYVVLNGDLLELPFKVK